MFLLLIFSMILEHQCLADDGSDIDFEQYLIVGRHVSSCSISDRFRPLHRAAMRGNAKMTVRVLQEMKESGNNSIDYQDGEGMTALHWAALTGHGGIIQSLLESGANISSVDKFGNTALHLAAHSGNVKALQWLILFGGDLNAKNQNGSTALHLAIEKESFPIAELLLSHCGSFNTTDYKGKTPLDIAVATNNLAIIALLRAAGADNVLKPELYQWVDRKEEDYDLPPCALKGGSTYGGHPLYIGRIWHQTGYIPATIIPDHRKTIAVIGGKYSEVSVPYQLLCGEHLAWKPRKPNDDIPETAVIVAKTIRGENIYLGRAYVSYSGKDIMTPGKVSGARRDLTVPFYSTDSLATFSEYEILIVSH